MYIGKFIEQEMTLIECENGKEVSGERTLEELYAEGYKNVCLVEKPSETATCTYDEYQDCFVQVWHDEPEQGDEISDTEALNIITGKE